VTAAASSEVPPNVAEARAWIAAWRAKQQQGGAAVPASNGNGASSAAKPAAAAARAPAKGAGGKFGASASFSDGTLLFTAADLASVQYTDVKLKGSTKKR
jgi:hypothetical protein